MNATTLFFLLALTQCAAWIPNRQRVSLLTPPLHFSAVDKDPSSDNGNPCWEDIYDSDCPMENMFSASFVAADWIKSMPCGAGIEDCDMPEELKVPDARPEAGIDHVDVMSLLGLKRAQGLSAPKDDPLAP